MANPKRPLDPNQRAKLVVDIATGESAEPKAPEPKDPAAVERGRMGGRKGGEARALRLSKKERSDLAKRAAEARWGRAD